MTHRLVRLFAVLGMAAALVAVPATAQAAGTSTTAADASTQAFLPGDYVIAEGATVLHCTVPWLTVGYGDAIGQCTQVYGGLARPGLWINGKFSSSSAWYQLANANWFSSWWLCADDGGCGIVGGYGVLATPYGAAVFVTQYRGEEGRWGSWNLHTNKFYPGGPWLDVQ